VRHPCERTSWDAFHIFGRERFTTGSTLQSLGAAVSKFPHDDSIRRPDANDERACGDCPLAIDRRAFLRDTALAALGAVGAVAVTPALAHAVRAVRPTRATGLERVYEIPATDGVSIDEENEVILVRWQRRAYAFSSRCTHRGARLEWRPGEGRVFCPKHKARFRPDGAHDSGRRTRDLDRYGIRRSAAGLAISLDVLHRVDQDPQAWSRAFVQIA
jgi:nitrite reductase/ring-hydroxylating ferredoxin subunit